MPGTIIGSTYEFNNYRHKGFSPFFKRIFFMDDSVCTVGIAEALHGLPVAISGKGEGIQPLT